MCTLIIAILVVILFIKLMNDRHEQFSDSGLNMSDRRCMEMVAHHKPYITDPRMRQQYAARICSHLRRHVVDEGTGNYFNTHGGYTLPVNHFNSQYT